MPVFANWEKSKGDFRLYEKRQKVRIVFRICLEFVLMEAAHTGAARKAPPSSFPGNYTQRLSIKPRGFELCLWASVLYLSLFVHLLATCVLQYQKSLWDLVRLLRLVQNWIELNIFGTIW